MVTSDPSQPLLIRADADTQIGTGHLMRGLALGQAWQDAGGRAVFLMAVETPPLEARLRSEGMEVVRLPVQPGSTDDAIRTADFAHQVGADWVVVDGYHFGADYQRIIKDSGLRLVFIDDIGHAEHYSADLVLNQNIHAHEDLYPNREPYTRLLLGRVMCSCDESFSSGGAGSGRYRRWRVRCWSPWGGSDPDNVTLKVIQALQQVDMDGLEAIVVVGGSNPNHEELQAAVQDSRFPIRLESNVTDMPELMAWADVAVSAGGSTCWELAFMGMPTVALILARNQCPIAERLDTVGVAVNLGWYEDVSPKKLAQVVMQLLKAPRTRAEMSQCGRQLVDSMGSDRVIQALQRRTQPHQSRVWV